MNVQNHNAYPLCTTRDQQIACVAECMRRLGEGCTEDDIKAALGITSAELKSVVDPARALAMKLSITQTRASVPARRAA